MKKIRILMLLIFALLFSSCDTAVKADDLPDNEAIDSVKDIDGNVYSTVTIGTQTWMVENLKTTRYRNGDYIDYVPDNTTWKSFSTGAWCNYANIAANGKKYGHLYNWYAVNDSRSIAPAGWRVASDAEWKILTDYVSKHLGASLSVAKALAATTEWATYSFMTDAVGANLALNNSTGFSALPGGYRIDDGTFHSEGNLGYWWSRTDNWSGDAWYKRVDYNNNYVGTYLNSKVDGFSVRCVKN